MDTFSVETDTQTLACSSLGRVSTVCVLFSRICLTERPTSERDLTAEENTALSPAGPASYRETVRLHSSEETALYRNSHVSLILVAACSRYDTYSVPNGMSVQGIYDTQMFTMVFGSAEEYSNYLMEESGESNSFFRKSKSVTNAYGMAEKHTKNLYLGMVSIDITR